MGDAIELTVGQGQAPERMVEGANDIVHADTVVEGDVFGKVDIEYPERRTRLGGAVAQGCR
jgi:hypothetical protein